MYLRAGLSHHVMCFTIHRLIESDILKLKTTSSYTSVPDKSLQGRGEQEYNSSFSAGSNVFVNFQYFHIFLSETTAVV